MPCSDAACRRIDAAIEGDDNLLAPMLWSYEVVSPIRKHVAAGRLSDAEAGIAIDVFAGLGVRAAEIGLEWVHLIAGEAAG